MITQEPVPPGFVRMASGQLVPATNPAGNQAPKNRKFLIVMQYYAGDMAVAEELCNLIADLERIKNHDADILLFARHDAPEFPRATVMKLEQKFDKVGFLRCRRRDGTGYPFAPNQMFGDLVTTLGQINPWRNEYFAFINLESDCVPVHPGWIGELIAEYKKAFAVDRHAVGFIHDNPLKHLNGMAVYDTGIWSVVGGGRLTGADPAICYDIYHANDLLPTAFDSPLIYFEYQRPTIKAEDLFKSRRGAEPAIFHGVKDGSARAAVRAKYIERGAGEQDLSSRTVFTYYTAEGTANTSDHNRILNFWRDGWKSRGWNTVVLSLRDATKNGRYAAYWERMSKLPFLGDPQAKKNRFLRWLALDAMGGGLLTDFDVLPGQFTPELNHKRVADGVVCYAGEGDTSISALYLASDMTGPWLDHLMAYDARPEDQLQGSPHVTDLSAWKGSKQAKKHSFPLVQLYGQDNWKAAPMIHFTLDSVMRDGMGAKRSVAMENYLRGS